MIVRHLLAPLGCVAMLLAGPALARAPAARTDPVAVALAALPQGARMGLLVVDDKGAVLAQANADQRMVPASTTKLFTTAAALALLPDPTAPDATGGADVVLEGPARAPDVVLRGHGDARLSSASGCTQDCLSTLVDALVTRLGRGARVARVIGDDSAMADERWPSGMSWDNMATGSGTAISALTLDDNLAILPIASGAPGTPAVLTAPPGVTIRGTVLSQTGGGAPFTRQMAVGSDTWQVGGTIPAGQALTVPLALADPAAHAAAVLRAMLVARGIRVSGPALARHRSSSPQPSSPPPPSSTPLARLVPPPLAEDVALTLRQSQNLHAELLLRRLGASGTVADGLAARQAALAPAQLPPGSTSLYDGSGMSTYNRTSPRALVALLRWGLAQPWGPLWQAGWPIAGQNGTLKGRLRGTALDGQLRAKTGTLMGTQALAGTFPAASGRVLTFAVLVNDLPEGKSATPALDALLLALAAAF
ncbi:MAG: D-alanyl-D-alanine carboxypeptidase/D-alanyl-D-alanine-endopeptidase [Novosphingobium aromaticivorans]|nr:D-alanyl-D-alanine carboxypeptidase/D-alanyl-D-alanine-endopeptidase [Novosphingobium aromaticivorans]